LGEPQLKVAVVGKGGVGKTFVAGTLAKLLRKAGQNVIAIDADPAVTLHFELNIDEETLKAVTPLSENRALIQERTGTNIDDSYSVFNLNPVVDDIIEKYAIESPDGVKLLIAGTVKSSGEGCMCPANALLRALLRHVFVRLPAAVIVDMEAGLEHFGRGTIQHVDAILNILEPSMQSIEVSLKIQRLARELGIKRHLFIANKVSGESEKDFVEKTLAGNGQRLELVIPYDENVRLRWITKERSSLPGCSPAAIAVEELRKRLYSA